MIIVITVASSLFLSFIINGSKTLQLAKNGKSFQREGNSAKYWSKKCYYTVKQGTEPTTPSTGCLMIRCQDHLATWPLPWVFYMECVYSWKTNKYNQFHCNLTQTWHKSCKLIQKFTIVSQARHPFFHKMQRPTFTEYSVLRFVITFTIKTKVKSWVNYLQITQCSLLLRFVLVYKALVCIYEMFQQISHCLLLLWFVLVYIFCICILCYGISL